MIEEEEISVKSSKSEDTSKMTDDNAYKTIRVIRFDGARQDWEGWEESFLAKADSLGYKELLLCKKNEVGVDKVPTATEVEDVEAKAKSNRDADDKKILALRDSNKLAYRDLILSINHKTKEGKVAFKIVKNTKSKDYPDGNSTEAWSHLVRKYSPKTTPSLLKYKREFENSKLKAGTDPEEWIGDLEGICTEIEAIDASAAISEKDLMVKVINNLPEEYDVVVDGLENKLSLSGDEALTVEKMRDKLNDRYQRILDHKEEDKGKGPVEDDVALTSYAKRLRMGVKTPLSPCKTCGSMYHKTRDCTRLGGRHSRDESEKGIKCWTCGEYGHMARKCRSKREEHAAYAGLACEYEKVPESEFGRDDEGKLVFW